MRKFVKGFCSFGGALAVIGGVLLLVGLLMGGRAVDLSLGWDNGPKLYQTDIADEIAQDIGAGRKNTPHSAYPPALEGEITSLSIELGAADVTVQSGEKYNLELDDASFVYTSTVNSNVWRIANTGIHLWRQSRAPHFIITVPRGVVLENLSLSIGAGTLTADGLSCKASELRVGLGTMKLTDFTTEGPCQMTVGMGALTLDGALNGHTSVDCGMGEAKLLLARPAEYGYAVKCGMGKAEVDGHRQSGGRFSSQPHTNAKASCFFDVRCGMGTAKVQFRD
ncbi:MAG: hypothetical protein RSG59_01090 [Ruthenibacterium sp.]